MSAWLQINVRKEKFRGIVGAGHKLIIIIICLLLFLFNY